MKLSDLSDDDLATCVDLYCERVLSRMRSLECAKPIHIFISCYQYGQIDQFKIEHKLDIGYHDNKLTDNSNNCLHGIHRLLEREIVIDAVAPIARTFALPALEQEGEIAVFMEDEDDNIPF